MFAHANVMVQWSCTCTGLGAGTMRLLDIAMASRSGVW